MRVFVRIALAVLALAAVALWVVWPGPAEHEGPGTVTEARVPPEAVAARAERQAEALYGPGAERAGRRPAKQILFGDLHVHTTFSTDAFLRSLPLMAGEGAHPPADACDFARFCSDLDFWSINDHSEGITPRHWRETVDSIRQCDAVAGRGPDPDVVPFLGWEWTQVGISPETHYGHKNIVLREIGEGRVPARPVSARGGITRVALRGPPGFKARALMPLLDYRNRQRYYDFWLYLEELAATPTCPPGVDVHDLPDDCIDSADSPDVLFEKLDQWGFPALVIPHGNTWGFYTPPGVSWDKQLHGAMHDPERQKLIEVYSGHGNSEQYRDWRAVTFDAQGQPVCPEPTDDYLPCCWQAGELMRARCSEDVPKGECERRVAEAREDYVRMGVAGHLAVPGATAEEWKGCGQCTDCFNPAFNYRPGGSTQYALAISNFDGPTPRRFRFGFIGSSDNHSARPGTGYKEFARRYMTEASGPRDETWRKRFAGAEIERSPEPYLFDIEHFDPNKLPMNPLRMVEAERQASFFMTGGLVALHAEGRDRDAIWEALQRREVYGTSGDRILLWFDLTNAPDGERPMGSEVELSWNPRFRVRAAGALVQKPGCSDYALQALGPERLERLCRGECYNPGDERRRITRIEIVRIRPQVRPDEPVAGRIEDPWRRFACAPDAAGCTVEFEDREFGGSDRPALYYARAIQEPTPAVNAGGLRCTYDEAGRCTEVHLCYGDYRTPFDDDCLSPNEERAWSSPIYVNPPGETAAR
jgi:Protein of unknown function (DUF3604)